MQKEILQMNTLKDNSTILFCEYYKQWISVYKEGAILDAVDEGLISRDPTRKAIIKGKKPREKNQNSLTSLSCIN